MSRTYKTAPFMVNLFKEYNIQLVEEHDCERVGLDECDLPEPNPKSVHQSPKTQCYWSYLLIGKNTCGCPSCSLSKERKLERRDARHSAKAELRRLQKKTRAYDELDDEEVLEEEIEFVDPVVIDRWNAGKLPESYWDAVRRKENEAEMDERFRHREELAQRGEEVLAPEVTILRDEDSADEPDENTELFILYPPTNP